MQKGIFTIFAVMSTLLASAPAADKTLIDYFLPMPVKGHLTKDVWGADNVLPRDPDNGLEDTRIKQWCYWDGQIIKGPDGKYHMFASRWDQSRGHKGWFGSLAGHAVSDNVVGPYKDTALTLFRFSVKWRGGRSPLMISVNEYSAPSGRGFSRHKGLPIRYGFGQSAKGELPRPATSSR